MEDFDCDDFEKMLKVIVVGNGNVGKTSMTTRYTKGKYTGAYKKTIGVDFMEKTVELRNLGETIHLMIWDTAGQEEFDTLTSRYYKGSGAVIYVFSTVDRASFDDLPKWKRKVEEKCAPVCSVLVQNKIDLEDDAAMTRDEIEGMADCLNMRLYRCCVQDNINVGEVFRYLCRKFLRYGDDSGETGFAVNDISMLCEASAPKELPFDLKSAEDISGIGFGSTSTVATSPTIQNQIKMQLTPSPSRNVDREYAIDSGNEAESKKEFCEDDIRKSQKQQIATDRDLKLTVDDAEVCPRGTSCNSENESIKMKPSKRRTNGKKTRPPPGCYIS